MAAPGILLRLAQRLNANPARVSLHSASKRAAVAMILRARPQSPLSPSTHMAAAPGSVSAESQLSAEAVSARSDVATPQGNASTHARAEARPASLAGTASSQSGLHSQALNAADLYAFDPRSGSFLDSPAARASTLSSAEILYIKRSFSPKDPWSGNVAFPGGRVEPNETDYDAAVRETREEIGLDLSAQPRPFMYLGRLDDRPVYARGRRQHMALCPFVFLQTCEDTPALTLNTSEVASVRWVPLAHLQEPRVDPFGITMPFRLVPGITHIPEIIRRWIGIDVVHHPSIILSSPEMRTGPGSLATAVMAELTSSQSSRPGQSSDTTHTHADASGAPDASRPPLAQDPDVFQLWGLTMQATSDLLAAAGLTRLNWPPIRFRGGVVNTWVFALCGGVELSEVVRGQRAARDVNAKHVAWFMALMATPVLLYAAVKAAAAMPWPRL